MQIPHGGENVNYGHEEESEQGVQTTKPAVQWYNSNIKQLMCTDRNNKVQAQSYDWSRYTSFLFFSNARNALTLQREKKKPELVTYTDNVLTTKTKSNEPVSYK